MGPAVQLALVLCLAAPAAWAVFPEPDLPAAGVLSPDVNHGMDPTIDYGVFTGRVSDKDDAGRVFKVQVENNNSKFFRAGDVLYFRVQDREGAKCKGFVRTVEDHYFAMHVENLDPCWPDAYFRRGTVLRFESPVLAQRVFEASQFRQIVLARKDDFLRQLNGINHFLWNFDQEKVKVAADFDARILEMQTAKQRALDDLVHQRQEKSVLQGELMKRLNETDEALRFYRVERRELLTDRWNLDHDMSLPVGHRPQELRKE
jgi:hypothetical protein